MMQRGDQVPHFDVVDVAGARVSYDAIWQRQNLLLISVDDAASGRDIRGRIDARARDIAVCDAVCVVTADAIAGVPRPGVVVADRWGEVYAVLAGEAPPVEELIEWLDFVQRQCPECQGEVR